jgi:hypothetical protein
MKRWCDALLKGGTTEAFGTYLDPIERVGYPPARSWAVKWDAC